MKNIKMMAAKMALLKLNDVAELEHSLSVLSKKNSSIQFRHLSQNILIGLNDQNMQGKFHRSQDIVVLTDEALIYIND